MPITFPPAVARFNQRINNPIQGQWAWLLPPWALVVHHGRKTGRRFSTPVTAVTHGDELVIPMLYGRDSQWARNLEAGGGEVIRGGKRRPLVDVRVTTTPPDGLGPVARRIAGGAEHQLVARMGEPVPATVRELRALRPRSRRRGS